MLKAKLIFPSKLHVQSTCKYMYKVHVQNTCKYMYKVHVQNTLKKYK